MFTLFIFIFKGFLSQKPLSTLTCLENPDLFTVLLAESCANEPKAFQDRSPVPAKAICQVWQCGGPLWRGSRASRGFPSGVAGWGATLEGLQSQPKLPIRCGREWATLEECQLGQVHKGTPEQGKQC